MESTGLDFVVVAPVLDPSRWPRRKLDEIESEGSDSDEDEPDERDSLIQRLLQELALASPRATRPRRRAEEGRARPGATA